MTWFDALMPAMQEILDSVAVHLPPLTQSIGALFAVVLGGVIRGFTGFGAALVIVPIVAIVYDPKTAIALHALIEIPSIMQLLPDATRDCARKTVVPMLFAVLVSLPAGMYF